MQPLGGVRACLDLAAQLGLPVVVSSALESSVGIAQGVALAAALPGIELASGLATVRLFERDVTETPLVPVDGFLPVGRVHPAPALVEPPLVELVEPRVSTSSPDESAIHARWLDRLGRVAALAGIDLAKVLA